MHYILATHTYQIQSGVPDEYKTAIAEALATYPLTPDDTITYRDFSPLDKPLEWHLELKLVIRDVKPEYSGYYFNHGNEILKDLARKAQLTGIVKNYSLQPASMSAELLEDPDPDSDPHTGNETHD